MEILIPIVLIGGIVGFIIWRSKSKKKATGSGGSGVGGGSSRPNMKEK